LPTYEKHYIQLTSLVDGHSFALFTELFHIYIYYILLFTNYTGEKRLSLVTGSKLGCHVFVLDFQRNSFSLV